MILIEFISIDIIIPSFWEEIRKKDMISYPVNDG